MTSLPRRNCSLVRNGSSDLRFSLGRRLPGSPTETRIANYLTSAIPIRPASGILSRPRQRLQRRGPSPICTGFLLRQRYQRALSLVGATANGMILGGGNFHPLINCLNITLPNPIVKSGELL